MKILFISHTGGRGGGETVLLDLIRTVANNTEHSIFLGLPNDGNNGFMDGLGELAEHCTVERFPFRPVRNTYPLLVRNLGYGILLGLPKMVRFIKANKIDLVYVNSSVNVIGIMAARKAGCKYIWHIHEQSNDEFRWAPKWFNKFYKKWLSDKHCNSIFVSHTNKNLWLSDLGIDQIPNSTVLYSQYKQIMRTVTDQKRLFTFGYIGSLTRNKNVGRLIEAFVILPTGCKLLIGGLGESDIQLKIAAKENPNIEFIGYVNNLEQFYSRIDCLVIPSLNESWGLVALEAISAGVPVVMTKNSGLVELLDHEKESIFVEPTSVEAIAEAMRKVAQSSDFARAMSESATKKLAELDINNNFTLQILRIINEHEA